MLSCRAPVYPPKTITFEIGVADQHMQPVLGHYQVAMTEATQTFLLPANAPIGQYLRIVLHGKVQQQFEDRQYFTAIRRVKAVGECLPSAAILEASQLLHTAQLQLSQTLHMPATLYPQLRSSPSARYAAGTCNATSKLLDHSCLLYMTVACPTATTCFGCSTYVNLMISITAGMYN